MQMVYGWFFSYRIVRYLIAKKRPRSHTVCHEELLDMVVGRQDAWIAIFPHSDCCIYNSKTLSESRSKAETIVKIKQNSVLQSFL